MTQAYEAGPAPDRMDVTLPHRHAESMLRPGQVFGTASRQTRFDDFTLTLTEYAAGVHLPSHAHERPMFVYVASGSFRDLSGRYDRMCGPRRLLFRPAGERHDQRIGGSGSTCLVIELPPTGGCSVSAASAWHLELHGWPTLLAMQLLDGIECGDCLATPGTEECLIRLQEVVEQCPSRHERTRPHWLDRIREALHDRGDQPVRLRDLALEVGVHRVHLSRTFRHFFGCSVLEYVRRYRVHEACRLMLRGHDSLAAVAAAVGFSDQSHMGRAFRRVLGCAPGTYRQAVVRRKEGRGLPRFGAPTSRTSG